MDPNNDKLSEEQEAEPFIEINEGLAVVAVTCALFVLAVGLALAIGEHVWGYPYKALQTPTLMDKHR
ncbi:MAG: hypothetical protein RLZZ20_1991 [Pseudomonadota bacterium]|jgi:hypothetical protein